MMRTRFDVLHGKRFNVTCAHQTETSNATAIGKGDMSAIWFQFPASRFVFDASVVFLIARIALLAGLFRFAVVIETRDGKPGAIILVAGAFATRSDEAAVAASLSLHFTVFAYDRRGRGESGDTAPYAVEREVEDLDALITEAGGAAFVFGHSSGAILALEAAHRLPTKITKLAVYEPPFIVDESRPPLPKDYMTQLTGLISSGQRGEAVEYFMTRAVGVPLEEVAQMRKVLMW